MLPVGDKVLISVLFGVVSENIGAQVELVARVVFAHPVRLLGVAFENIERPGSLAIEADLARVQAKLAPIAAFWSCLR